MDFIYFLGRFHVLVLHLPIGIIVALVVLEWVSRRDKYRYLQVAAPFLWEVLALSALATVLLGYMHFSEGGFSGPSGYQHRWFGTAFALLATGFAVLRTTRFAEEYRPVFFPASIMLLVLVSITGHFGGNLTHGSTFLFEYAPQPLRSLVGLEPKRKITSVAAADPFADVVGPMLKDHCSGCHNADKQENGLNLTSYTAAMKGGDSGRVITAGKPETSELVRRISLDPADDEFMPAEGKPPLSAAQVEIIRWWVSAGAPSGVAIGTLDVPNETKALLSEELGVDF